MKTFLKILRSESSKIIHIAFLLGLYVDIEKSIVLMLFFGIEVVYLFQKSKNLLVIGFLIILLFQARIFLVQEKEYSLPTTELVGEVVDVSDTALILKSQFGKVIVYGAVTSNFLPGDSLKLTGRAFENETRQIEHTFDYQKYLQSIQVRGQFYLDDYQMTGHQFHLKEIRVKLERWIDARYAQESSPYLKMFVLGNDSSIDEAQIQMFRNLGISHLFAISGMHVGLILLFLQQILSRFYLSERLEKRITFFFLFLYNVITGFSISIVRASALVLLIYVNKQKKWYFSKTDLLSMIFIAFLFYEPNMLSQAGFQLSFLITFAILLSSPIFKEYSKWIQLVLIQLIATLFSLPIVLSLNQGYGLLSVFASILFLEGITFLLLPMSFLTIIISPLQGIYATLIRSFTYVIEIFDSANPFLFFQFPRLEYIFIFYIGLILFMTKLLQKKNIIMPFIVMIYSILIAMIHPMNPVLSRVVFLDVGQGDATYIQTPGCRLLIDTGPTDEYDNLIRFLKGENVYSLDAVVISHFHEDHFGELNDLLIQLEVEHVYSSHFDSRYPALELLNIGDEIKCEGVSLNVIHANTSSQNENNNSLALYGVIGWDTFLFTGDLEECEEDSLLSPLSQPIDVLKVAHHGSITSTSENFLDATNPSIAIISVGKNSYGQPSSIVLDRLIQQHTTVYMTRDQGTVSLSYYSLGHFRTIQKYQHQKSFLT